MSFKAVCSKISKSVSRRSWLWLGHGLAHRGTLQKLGWQVDQQGINDLENAITGNGTPDPDIGKLKKPRLVSKARARTLCSSSYQL